VIASSFLYREGIVDVFLSSKLFRYFQGGKDGIKERLAKQISDGLATYDLNAEVLEKEVHLSAGTITNIISGDISGINAQVIEEIADPINLRVR